MSLIPGIVEREVNRELDAVVRLIGYSKIRPNSISTLGFILNLTAACFLVMGEFLIAGVLILVAGALDLIDGKFARLTSQVTVFGAIYDATMDRIGELAIYTGVGAYLVIHHMYMTALVVVVATGGSLLISYVRARAESFNIPCNVGILRRGERILLFGLGSMLNFLNNYYHEPLHSMVASLHLPYRFALPPITLALLAIAVLAPVTVAQRLLHVKRQVSVAA